MDKIVAIRRADRFSPNSVDDDRLILEAVTGELHAHYGIDVPIIDEERFCASPVDAGIYLSMGRMPQTLTILACKEHRGSRVVNSPGGVRLCSHRSLLDKTMRQAGISMPPLSGNGGYWLKRGDSAAQSRNDVVYCADEAAVEMAETAFKARGINEVVVSTHVDGDLIKFYGVGDIMFSYTYNNDGERSKFGNERLNGDAHHYPFDDGALCGEVQRLARLAGVLVYGGDAIVDKTGKYYIIDFNDWPTFANCRHEAAKAIDKCLGDLR